MTDSSLPIVKPDVVFIEDLLDRIVNGALRVPRFQRPFVWKPRDMRDLFDSIYRGYSIGSLLLWEPNEGESIQTLDMVGPVSIGTPRDSSAYILDGHQRLATLVGSLRPGEERASHQSQDEWWWKIWFDLKNESFTHVPREEPAAWLFPIHAVLRTVTFLAECRKIEEKMGSESSACIEKAESLAQKIKNYKVAVTTIEGGGLREAVEIFSRLNKHGEKITPDQMVSALTYNVGEGGLDLSEEIGQILAKMSSYYFGHVGRLIVLRSIMANTNVDIFAGDWTTIAKRHSNAELRPMVEKGEESLIQSSRFLHDVVGVPGDRLLPYGNQLLLLACFFASLPEGAEASAEQSAALTKWFWSTSMSGWFATTNASRLREAVTEMRLLARDSGHTLNKIIGDAPARSFPGKFNLRSARLRAFLVFLLSLKPKDPETGELIEIDRAIQEDPRYAFGLVFPRAKGDARANPANRVLLRNGPGNSVAERLCRIPEEKRQVVLDSHGIPDEAYAALLGDDAVGFVNARERHLIGLERDFMATLGITPSSNDDAGPADDDADDGDE